ncbi:MAG: MCP four helix bundle domain-containing protein, partial [Deltaproteobacteria bacterium]|nr:MCP four helix bundle domain-containing protein [Deltaproteobacteria bacterium]
MLSRVKIGPKLIGGFLIVCALMAGMGIYALGNITRIAESGARLYGQITVPIEQLMQLSTAYQRSRSNVRDLLLTSDVGIRRDYLERIASRMRELDAAAAVYERTLVDDEGRKAFARYEAAAKGYREAQQRVLTLAEQGKREEAYAALRAGVPAEDAVRDALHDLAEAKVTLGEKTTGEDAAQASSAKSTTATALAGIVLLALGLGLYLTFSITRPLKQMAQIAKGLAQGNVDQSIELRSEDEVGQLADAFRETIDYIQGVARGAKSLAAGDLSVELKARSQSDVLALGFAEAAHSVRAMSEEIQRLVAAAKQGKL